jgi:lipopolysaccharide transport system ATP-binding protein
MVDEVIAVGDEEFQRKCFDHLFELRKRGVTIVLVSHSLGLIRDLCDEAAWLDHGRIRQMGPAREVVDGYLADVNEREAHTAAAEQASAAGSPEAGHLGTGEVRITAVEFLDRDGVASPVLLTGDPCTVRLHYRADAPVDRAVFGIGFLHESGANVSGPNSGRVGPWSISVGEGVVDYVVPELLLGPATYQVSTAIVDRGHMFDYADRLFDVRVRGQGDEEPGLARMPGTWVPPVTIATLGARRPTQEVPRARN